MAKKMLEKGETKAEKAITRNVYSKKCNKIR